MAKIQYEEVDEIAMQPDVYSGDSCDEVKPRWMANVEKEGWCDEGETLTLAAKHFAPGTRIVVMVPVCPTCGLNANYCHNLPEHSRAEEGICECGFNWNEWALDQYS